MRVRLTARVVALVALRALHQGGRSVREDAFAIGTSACTDLCVLTTIERNRESVEATVLVAVADFARLGGGYGGTTTITSSFGYPQSISFRLDGARVGLGGFEPPTSTSRTWRANQAALQPVAFKIPPARLSPTRGDRLDPAERVLFPWFGRRSGLSQKGVGMYRNGRLGSR
jgi:hypothetical protein